MKINELFKLTMDKKASDLHFTVGRPPLIRIDGRLQLTDYPVLNDKELKDLIYGILNDEQKKYLEQNKELDFSFSSAGLDRFRINAHFQRGNVEAAFRRIPSVMPKFEELGIPPIAYEFIRKPNGLVLVTGPT